MKIYRIYGKGDSSVKVSLALAQELEHMGVVVQEDPDEIDGHTIYKYRRASNKEYLASPIPEDVA